MPLAAAVLLLALASGCLCPKLSEDHWGEWEVVDSSHESKPSWVDAPQSGCVTGEGEAYGQAFARSKANYAVVKNAAATRGVRVISEAVRRDTEDESKFREKTVVRINQSLSLEVTDIYWVERLRVGIKHGKPSWERKFRYVVQGRTIDA